MDKPIISKRTRNAFREFLVGWTLREIEMEFEAADIASDQTHDPQLSGQRRSFVEQHYHTLDFSKADDVRRLLSVYEGILSTATKALEASQDKSVGQRNIDELKGCLHKDGFVFRDGKIRGAIPETRGIFDNTAPNRRVTEITRRNIIDDFNKTPISLSGRLSEIEFLSRLYDLDSLPSDDTRFTTAREDIWQHRVNNPGDWPDEWIFLDSRFDLLHCSDESFLRFICEMLHPIVRANSEEVRNLKDIFDRHLAADGWQIVAKTHISGRPVFAARRSVMGATATVGTIKTIAATLDADYVAQQITRMEAAIESDPELAIGTSKELLETICKTILHNVGRPPSSSADLPQLVKLVREELDLLPDDIPEKAKGADTIKRLLSNLGTVAQGIAELRGIYGTGHGKKAQTKGLQTRHARLAVGAASTLAVFLFETYKDRRETNSSAKFSRHPSVVTPEKADENH